jgi:hypothetical protein
LAKIAAIQMENGWTFSTHSFMKSNSRNHLNEHLNIVVGMYSQTFYNFNIFPYDACFENLKEQKPSEHWIILFYYYLGGVCSSNPIINGPFSMMTFNNG